ncbi:MAG: hypothetical protein ACRD50_10395 [Candidatus Acidiferrales bacterium]
MRSDLHRSKVRFVWGAINQYGFHLFFGQLGRMIYGNDIGFAKNVLAMRDLKKQQRRSGDVADADPRADFLRSQGYVKLDLTCSRALIEEVRRKYQALLTHPLLSRDLSPRMSNIMRGVVDPIKHIPEFQHFITPEVQRILRAYYVSHFKVDHVRAWRNFHVPEEQRKKDVFSNLWHNDQCPVTTLKLFVCLSDGVTRENGSLRLHPIPSTKKIMRLGYMRRRLTIGPARRLLEDSSHTVYFEGNLGSACILNPQQCLHGAGVPQEGKFRDMVQFSFSPSDKPLSDDWPATLPLDPEVSSPMPTSR